MPSNRPIRYIGAVTIRNRYFAIACESECIRRRCVSRPIGDRCELKWHRGLELCISNDFAKLSHPRNKRTDYHLSRARVTWPTERSRDLVIGKGSIVCRFQNRWRDRVRSLRHFRWHLRRHCEVMSIAMQRKYRDITIINRKIQRLMKLTCTMFSEGKRGAESNVENRSRDLWMKMRRQ